MNKSLYNNSQSEQVCQEELEEDNFPTSPIPNIKSNDVAYMLIDRKELSTAYTDLTGRFPMRSSRGNQYILIGYHYDANCIHGIAIKIGKRPLSQLHGNHYTIYLRRQVLLQTRMSWIMKYQMI